MGSRNTLAAATQVSVDAQQALNAYALTGPRNTAEYRRLVKAAKVANQAQFEAAQATRNPGF